MSAVLVVFVDALPFSSLEAAPFLRSFDFVRRQQPGFGYSINNYAELFAGLTPDAVGFLNEWSYKPGGSEFSAYSPVLSLLATLRRSVYADWGAHRILEEWLGFTGFVPFDYLEWLGRSGHPVFAPDFQHSSVLDAPGLEHIVYSKLGRAPYDDRALQFALERLSQTRKLLVTLVDLDVLTHIHGIGSRQHVSKINWLDNAIRALCRRFWNANPGGDVCIFSDQGQESNHRRMGS